MKILIKKDYRKLKAGTEIPIKPNEVNFWVGLNGSGKSTALSLLYSYYTQTINKKLRKSHYWKFESIDKDIIAIDDPIEVDDFYISSTKNNDACQVDMDALIERGIMSMRGSTGQIAMGELGDVYKFLSKAIKNNTNTFTILDEVDGHLDIFGKMLFFLKIIPQLVGASIIVTHDPLYIREKEVFDFTDMKIKTGEDYYKEHEERFLSKLRK